MSFQSISEENKEEAAVLLAAYWKERGMPEYGKAWAEDYLSTGHSKEIKSDEFFVLVEGGELVGLISFITDVSGVAEIRDMVVRPEHRHKGYGKKLLDGLVDTAKQRKLRKVFALAFPRYKELYSSAGFEEEGVLKSHFKDGEDLAVMSLLL
jgi:ribosomal protein S18 acetylase RimI-like enzyme